jgi:hypothetical protein
MRQADDGSRGSAATRATKNWDNMGSLSETFRMKTSRLAGALLATLCFLSYAGEAKAIGPVDIEIGAKGGYATNPSNLSGIPNGLGAGIGARAGVGIFGLYAGVNYLHYFGQDSLTADQFGGELGYSWKLSILTIRPQVGFGSLSYSGPNISTAALVGFNSGNFYVEPGLTALLSFGLLFVGADANALILTSGNNNPALTLHAQVGVKF